MYLHPLSTLFLNSLYTRTQLLFLQDEVPGKTQDPFYESQENHNLIGVANIFLEVLFHDVRLNYHTPIISQQGEVAGRLQVEISRISGQFPQDRICEAASESSADSTSSEAEDYSGSSHITCRVTIKQATGLPLSLSHFVFCQYMFWGHPEPIVVPPVVNTELPSSNCITGQRDSLTFKFDHTKDFTVPITEEFIEHSGGRNLLHFLSSFCDEAYMMALRITYIICYIRRRSAEYRSMGPSKRRFFT